MPIKKKLKIGIVAGEYSGDALGAGIIHALKNQNDVDLFGVGGPKLVSQGLICLLYTSPSPRDGNVSRMPSSA